MKTTKPHQSIEIKPYNIKELASLYNVGYRTIKKWLKAHQKAIGRKHGRYYTALQVQIIFEKLGLPSQVIDDE